MLLFFAALLPCLVWDRDPVTAPKAAADQLCTPAQADTASAEKLVSPGVEYRINEATASRSPWMNANGWRIQRSPKARFYYDVQGDAASLAAAESYAYGAKAAIHADSAGAQSFAAILPFLKILKPVDLPPVANIGLIDDGTDDAGELMNLLSRYNLLFRLVTAPDPRLDLNVRLGSPEYPKSEAADPGRLSHKIRSQLSDEKRRLRVYGSAVVIARLTGDSHQARLHLIDYDKRPVEGIHIRVLGEYPRHQASIFGVTDAKLLDYIVENGVTEFTIASMGRYAVIDLFPK